MHHAGATHPRQMALLVQTLYYYEIRQCKNLNTSSFDSVQMNGT